MALFSYMRRTQRILRDHRVQMINPTDLIVFINEARGQIAAEAQCLVAVGSLNITAASQVYPFSSITLPAGYVGPFNVRTIWRNDASGRVWMVPRSWPWFSLYYLTDPPLAAGAPRIWAQYGQGEAGTIYVSPIPNANYTLSVDSVCHPGPLVNDASLEIIPYIWTDAIAYYAAYLAMMSMETGTATAESDRMFQRYQRYMAVARSAASPLIQPANYAQTPPIPSNPLAAAPPQGRQ